MVNAYQDIQDTNKDGQVSENSDSEDLNQINDYHREPIGNMVRSVRDPFNARILVEKEEDLS